MTNPHKLHILYEYGADRRPHGSSFIRLLRPLTHPSLQDQFQVSAGLKYEGEAVDAVLLNRYWHPADVSLSQIKDLVNELRLANIRLIYDLDDNLLDLRVDRRNRELSGCVEYLLRQADCVLVSTSTLKERVSEYNRWIEVVPNSLDERLLVPRHPGLDSSPRGKKIIGYMGTHTHDDDLRMILPALQKICRQHQDQVEIQIIGALSRRESMADFQDLPIRYIEPEPGETEYPLFMLWFTSRIHWDVALCPLADNTFTYAKSDIKFLDYSAVGVAGIYSDVAAYSDTVRHLDNGWLANNDPLSWESALERLLSDDDLRLRLAKNAYAYLYRNRTLAHSSQIWADALHAALA